MKYYADMKKNEKDLYLLTRKGSITVAEESKLENNMSSMILLCNPSLPQKSIYIYCVHIYIYTYSWSSNNAISLLYNVDKKKKKSTPGWGQCMHGICTFSSCLCRFSPGTLVPAHIPKICSKGELARLNCPSLSVRGC